MAKEANILPIHLAVGDDDLKRAEVFERLKARMEHEDDLSFDCDDFDGETCTGADIVAACETIPFMATRRLVLVRNGHKLRKADQDALTDYAKEPSETTVLALSFEKLAKNTKLYKAISALGKTAIIDCALPKGRELQRKVAAMATAHGAVMDDAAATLLIEYVGTDTIFLDNEVEKIALICADKQRITVADVKEYAEATADAKPWKFLEPFSDRNLVASLQWLDSARGVSPHALVPQCAQRLRELMCVKSLEARGAGQAAVLSELGYSSAESWKIKNHTRYARRFSSDELRSALIALRDTEQAMKSGAQPDEAFRLWVVKALSR